MSSNNLKKKRSLFFPIIKFTIILIILGTAIYYYVPSITSKKEEYISIAKNLMDSVENFAKRGNIKVKDTTITYYIPASCVSFHDELKTPYGNLDEAYVIIIYNGKGYKTYWISKDSNKVGVPEITAYKDLNLDNIKHNINELNTNIAIDDKENIVVFNKDCSKSEKHLAYSFYNSKTGKTTTNNLINIENAQVYGKISIGDEITIGGKEHFYVTSIDDNKMTLLAKYNLYVGYKVVYNDENGYKIIKKISKDENEYGIQSSKTLEEGVGVVPFSSIIYWDNKDYEKIYNGSIYNKEIKENEPKFKYKIENGEEITIIDNNYSIAYYTEPYIKKIRDYGINVIEGRLLTSDEASLLGCSKEKNCQWFSNNWLKNTSFWLSSVEWNGLDKSRINTIDKDGFYKSEIYNSMSLYGVRPVIVIDKSIIEMNK